MPDNAGYGGTLPLACVLAGGLSSRMGRDKAGLEFAGQTLLDHALGRLREAGFAPFVSGARRHLPDEIPCIADKYLENGPLGGLEAALRFATELRSGDEPVLFLAVDLPFIPPAFLRVVWERAVLTGVLASIPYTGGRPQPLCAAYRPSLAPALARALEEGDRKVIRVLHRSMAIDHIDEYRSEALASANGLVNPGLWFRNINTPEDADILPRTRV